MFPTIVQIIKSGSPAEQTFLDYSDIDYIYEVGQFVVEQKTLFRKTFYFDVTENPGFYTVRDKEGGYLYPMSLQSSFASVTHGIKQTASLQKASATLPLINTTAATPHDPSYGLEWNVKSKIIKIRL